MRNFTLLTICLLLLFCNQINAQVTEGVAPMVQGEYNSYSVTISKANLKDVEKQWSKYIKEYKGKTKRFKGEGYVFTDNAKIKEMSENTVDVYATCLEQGEDIQVTAWFDLGGAYVASATHPQQHAIASLIMEDFIRNASSAMIKEELKSQESTLKKMTKELDDISDDEAKYQEEIAKCERKIEEAKMKIQELQAAQKEKTAEIASQEVVVETVRTKLEKYNN